MSVMMRNRWSVKRAVWFRSLSNTDFILVWKIQASRTNAKPATASGATNNHRMTQARGTSIKPASAMQM